MVLAKAEADLGDAILGTDSDERYGALGGGFGYYLFDNPQLDFHVFPWRKLRTQKNLGRGPTTTRTCWR